MQNYYLFCTGFSLPVINAVTRSALVVLIMIVSTFGDSHQETENIQVYYLQDLEITQHTWYAHREEGGEGGKAS